jgi:hypothetical protein
MSIPCLPSPGQFDLAIDALIALIRASAKFHVAYQDRTLMTPRTDDQKAATIYLALFLRHVINLEYATALLARRDVPLATATRVLTTLHRRGW